MAAKKSIKKPKSIVKNPKSKVKVRKKVVNKKSRNKNTRSYLLKRIVITNLLSLLVIVLTYFWMIYLLSSVNSFWDIFRNKEVYVEQDEIPPVRPYLKPLQESTNQDVIDVEGKAEPGVKIVLYIDDAKYDESVADSDGVFIFPDIPVGLSPISIYAQAEDDNNNISSSSITYYVFKDIEPPEIEIDTPENGEVYKSTGHNYKISGKTEPNAIVTINNQLAVINPNGDFFASLRLEQGSNEIKIIAKDIAGNEKEETIFMTFEKIE